VKKKDNEGEENDETFCTEKRRTEYASDIIEDR
jgi:hypothetical protein